MILFEFDIGPFGDFEKGFADAALQIEEYCAQKNLSAFIFYGHDTPTRVGRIELHKWKGDGLASAILNLLSVSSVAKVVDRRIVSTGSAINNALVSALLKLEIPIYPPALNSLLGQDQLFLVLGPSRAVASGFLEGMASIDPHGTSPKVHDTKTIEFLWSLGCCPVEIRRNFGNGFLSFLIHQPKLPEFLT